MTNSIMSTYTYGSFVPWNIPQPSTSVYIAPRNDGQPGNGIPSDPFDASNASKYDALVQRFSEDVAIYYAPGVYYTLGWDFGRPRSANPGCVHVGAGIDQTIVRLDPAATLVEHGSGSVRIFACDYNQRADGFQVWDMTLDGNANNNDQFQSGSGNISLVYCAGNNILIEGCKLMGWGTKAGECFVVFITPSNVAFAGESFSHAHVQNCLFTEPATGNKDGCSLACVGADKGITVTDYEVLNNEFIGVTSDFVYSHALCGIVNRGNLVNDCQTGWYSEPGSGGSGANNPVPMVIDSNTFIDVPFVAQAQFHPQGILGPITISNNVMMLSNRYDQFIGAIQLSGHQPTTVPAIPSITITGNEFVGIDTLLTDPCNYRCVYFAGLGKSAVVGKVILKDNRVHSTTPSGREFVINEGEIQDLDASDNTYHHGEIVPITYVED